MTKGQLLAEVEDLLRTMPPKSAIRHDTQENFAGLGRLSAAIKAWSFAESLPLGLAVKQLHGKMASDVSQGFSQIMTLLHQRMVPSYPRRPLRRLPMPLPQFARPMKTCGTRGRSNGDLHPAAVAWKVSQGAEGGKPLDSQEQGMVAVPRIERGTRGL